MTLRELINSVDRNVLYVRLNELDNEKNKPEVSYTLEQTVSAYENFLTELLAKEGNKDVMPFCVSWRHDFDIVDGEIIEDPDKKWIDVSLFNEKYEEPPADLKPYYGDNPPEGCYNANDNKYHKYFAVSGPWNDWIDARVIDKVGLDDVNLLAEICWELTFHGYTEIKQDEFWNDMKQQIEDYKAGKIGTVPLDDLLEDDGEE